MKKTLLQLTLLLLPFFALAQDEGSTLKDFSKKIAGIDETFKLNDHTYVMTLALDDENFELVAIDDQMQVLWRATVKGVSIGAGLFKGHILAVAASGESFTKGLIGPFTGFLLDQQTGKLQAEKVIYNSNTDTQELPKAFFNSDGSDFRLVVRQTNASKSFPFMASFKYVKNLSLTMETKDFTILTLNEKLDATITKPKFPDGNFLTMDCNDKGELYIAAYLENKSIKVFRYSQGKIEPETITQDIDLTKLDDNLNAKMGLSKDNRNIMYYAQVHNNQNKESELTVVKFDFGSHSAKVTNELLDKPHLKDLEKNFAGSDKMFDKPVINSGPSRYSSNYGVSVRRIEEYKGNLLITLSDLMLSGARNFDVAPYSLVRLKDRMDYTFSEHALVINCYDLNLQQKFQQVLPVQYFWEQPWTAGYHIYNNSYYVIANTTEPKHFSVCAQLDISTGQWVKIEKLPIDKSHVTSSNILWFNKNFIIPNIERVGMIYPQKQNIDMLSQSY